jgi:peptidylprolyl isomerase
VIDTELIDIVPRPETPPNVAAPPHDAIVTPSGLAYKVLRPGVSRIHPKMGDRVLVHYNGWTTDGHLFDSSVLTGKPVDQPVSSGVPGFTEGIQLMTAGAKYRFWMPPKLAFAGMPDKPQGMVVFDVELFTNSGEIMPKRGQVRTKTMGPKLPPGVPGGVHP